MKNYFLLLFSKLMTMMLLIVLIGNSYSQPHNVPLLDTTSTKFYPLRVGNSWTYYGHSSSFYYRFKLVVTDSVLMNGHIYFNITRYGQNPGYMGAFRVDSLFGRLLISTTTGCSWLQNEITKDSLSAHLNDSLMFSCDLKAVCSSISTVNLFGTSRQSIQHRYLLFSPPMSRQITWSYAYGIGQYYYFEDYFYSISYNLIGCVINGISYGDTSLTALLPVSALVPEDFHLQQNYPNPFNPTTKIKFDIPLSRGVDAEGGRGVLVKLIVYDLSGREITTLVNEHLQPGAYEAEWDGSNYASGVYFYKLITYGFAESRKMILIK